MSNETHLTYDLSNVLAFDEPTVLDPGTSLLVSGPAMTGKTALALDMLADGLEGREGAIAVSTSDTTSTLLEQLDSRAGAVDPEAIGAIDCRSSSGRNEALLDSGSYTYSVPEPSDFTGIGIGITNCLSRFEELDVEQSRLALDSLSMMITYADRQTVFKFCHVLASRLENAGYIGIFTIDRDVHDKQTMEVIKQAFDGVLELREVDGGREVRLRGLNPQPSEWHQL